MNTGAKLYQLIIIGSGPAGLTAGIYAGRANLHPLIIDGPTPGGQLISTSYVENWPGTKSILGPELMANMRQQAQFTGCTFLSETVTRTDFTKKPFLLFTKNGKELQSKSIIIATGATPKKLQVPGEQEYWGKGVSTCAVCDGVFFKDKPVIVVGGGDTAMEDASFMTKYTNQITIVQISDKLTASAAMQERILAHPSIKIIYNATVAEIKGDGSLVNAVKIKDQKTGAEQLLNTGVVFIAIGLNPNTDMFKGQLELLKSGHISVKDHTKTSVNGVFVAGDVADMRYRQAVTSAGAGCMAALDVDWYLKTF